jgi:hypothetical protein
MKWNKCSEELPFINPSRDWYESGSDNVLVTNGHNIFVARYSVDEEYGGKWIEFGRDGYTCNDITHWMALPNFP